MPAGKTDHAEIREVDKMQGRLVLVQAQGGKNQGEERQVRWWENRKGESIEHTVLPHGARKWYS